MEQGSGAKGYWNALTHELALGEAVEFGVENVKKFVSSSSVASFSLVEQRRDVAVGHIRDALARDSPSHFNQIVNAERQPN